MGNTNSSSDSEEDVNAEFKDEDDPSEDAGQLDKDSRPTLDLQDLFNSSTLRSAATKVKDDSLESMLQGNAYNILVEHQQHLVRLLENGQQLGEETVTLAQFCDVLMNRSVAREDCVIAFQHFDIEGDGNADSTAMLESLRALATSNLYGELGCVVRTLQACSLTPGFIDVYAEDKQSIGHHGTRILNFLLRNRAPTHLLPFPITTGFNNTSGMRLGALNTYLTKMMDSANRHHEETILCEGEQLKPITVCYKSIEVSTNKADAYRLTNSDMSSYWQSDGAARSHWIRLRMKNSVVIKQLCIVISSSDQSYMPQLVSVSVGKNSMSLREIREVRIPGHMMGEIPVLENCKTYYPLIQVNIKRCHTDGCDTRIHGLKTLGYRIVKESGISVTDAAASWYIQMLAMTATSCAPLVPQLRTNLLEHTRNALKYMMPLSLSPASTDKPAFVSSHMLQEIDTFLTNLASDNDGTVQEEGLNVLLAFNLARGNVASIIETLIRIKEDQELEMSGVMQNLAQVKDMYWKKIGGPIQLSLCGCDGGKQEDGATPESILTAAWSSPVANPYHTDDGKMKLNMFFKANDHVQLTKIRIKVEKGARGPKTGLVFVYSDSEPFDLEKHVERFQKYDTWASPEDNLTRSKDEDDSEDMPCTPFSMDEEWDEVELSLECPIGKYVLVKFLEPRQTSAERLGIVGIKFYGFHRKGIFVTAMSDVRPPPKKRKTLKRQEATASTNQDTKVRVLKRMSTSTSSECDAVKRDVVVQLTMDFLVALSRDQTVMNNLSSMKSGVVLDLTDVTIQLIWKLFTTFKEKRCHILTLQLLHSLFPHLTVAKNPDKASCESLFKQLCEIVDQKSSGDETDLQFVAVAKQVIVDGAAVFFPDKEARRKQLFNMMTDINATTESPSLTLIFQSLCRYFSSVDPSGLLDLPPVPTEEFDMGPVLGVMEKLLGVAHCEFQKVIVEATLTEQSSFLVQLFCSLQTSMLGWCYCHVGSDNKERSEIAQAVLIKYVQLISAKCTAALAQFEKIPVETKEKMIPKLEGTFLGTALPQMVLILTSLTNSLTSSTRMAVLASLQPLLQDFQKIARQLPEFFLKVESEHWKKIEDQEVVLRTWEVESSHNYENNQNTSQVFTCPGATTFVVEFDPRCETEKRYDYLEFTDARGAKTRYDQKVGNEKWPLSVTFKGGHRLHFLFHSDSSNNEWGYKFKVSAKGCPDVPLCWMFDAQLSLDKLFGSFCGKTLDSQLVLPKAEKPGDAQQEMEAELLRSDLWTTLFRGGYMVGKLQRSLSGKHVAMDEANTCTFLWSLVQGKDGIATLMLNKCRSHCGYQNIGGEEINECVNSVFAALVWHTQALREEIDKIIRFEGESKYPEGIYQAYSVAEALRTQLMEQRQKWKVAENDSGKSSPSPVTQCKEKAQFLLKFAGLSKVIFRCEYKSKVSRQVSRIRLPGYSQDKTVKLDGVMEKFPSFRLVLEFVKDPAWVRERVEQLLQQRSLQARAVADVYMMAAEVLRIQSDEHIFQVPNIVFLQEILTHQNHFARHYADGLDGCGLDLESRVRRSYYTLMRRMVDSVRAVNRSQLSRAVISAYDYMQACLLHLLDVNWQLYDLSFLTDIKLPQLVMDLAKGSVTMHEKIEYETDEEHEQLVYEHDLQALAECKTSFDSWYEREPDSEEEKKMRKMFIAKFCDLLDVEISCDGCTVTLPGHRYRCLQCLDMDLCSTCYAGGVKPGGEHTDDHDIIHMMYKCDECQAFIVGTRIHCNVCEDFDLCLGCQKAETFPGGHSKDHDVTHCPMVKLRLSSDTDTSLQSYIYQHAWLQFSSLALAMAHIIYHGTKVLTPDAVDVDYVKACVALHNTCIDLSNNCLMHVKNNPCIDSEPGTSGTDNRREEAFAVHSQERIMGLLGAMVPPENKTPISDDVNSTFTSVEFLRLLFTIARGESGHETNTQHMAMGLIAILLQRTATTPMVADKAISQALGKDLPGDMTEGQFTADFLFAFGATCLERSGLEWANSVAGILLRLFASSSWRHLLLNHIANWIQHFSQFSDSGKGKSAEMGEQLLKLVTNEDKETSTALKTLIDKKSSVNEPGEHIFQLMAETYKKQVSVALPLQEETTCSRLRTILAAMRADLARKQNQLKDELPADESEKINMECTELLLQIENKEVELAKAEEEGDKAGKDDSTTGLSPIFALFVIAGFPEVLSIGCHVKYLDISTEVRGGVVLKHFPEKSQTLVIDKGSRKRKTVKDEYIEWESQELNVLDSQHVVAFITVIKNMTSKLKAGQGKTSCGWLWVLALALKAVWRTLQSGVDAQSSQLFQSEFVQAIVHLAGTGTGFNKHWLLKDLEILSLMLYTRDGEKWDDAISRKVTKKETDEESAESAEAEDDPMAGLDETDKACLQTLHMHLHTPLKVLRELYDEHDQNTNAVIVAIHEKDKADSAASESAAEKTIDTGVHLAPVATPKDILVEGAVEEPCETSQHLISGTDSDVSSKAIKNRKNKSASLLKKELESQGKTGSREFLAKVNMGLSVLYARQVLMTLLAEWPADGQDITAQLIGCKENSQVPFVLDLLNRTEVKDTFQKVVDNVIRHSSKTSLVPIALTACNFMEEVSLSVIAKESEHDYKNYTYFEDKVHISGASSLSIKFDTRCSTEDGCDEVVMSTSADYSNDRRVFSGPRERWIDFELPGDTLYYKFSSDCSNSDWGYRFTVTGGKLGRFDTGYMILNSIMSMQNVIRMLPLNDLWPSLVHVACKQSSEQRLKALQLLLKMMNSQFKVHDTKQLGVDLALLRPLWQLYNKMANADSDAGIITPPVSRALTEFFLIAETLALEWDIVDEYMLSMLDNKDIHKIIYLGALNVAAVSNQIGYENKATDSIKAAIEKAEKK